MHMRLELRLFWNQENRPEGDGRCGESKIISVRFQIAGHNLLRTDVFSLFAAASSMSKAVFLFTELGAVVMIAELSDTRRSETAWRNWSESCLFWIIRILSPQSFASTSCALPPRHQRFLSRCAEPVLLRRDRKHLKQTAWLYSPTHSCQTQGAGCFSDFGESH